MHAYIKHATSKVWGRGEAPSPRPPAIRARLYGTSIAASVPASLGTTTGVGIGIGVGVGGVGVGVVR